jgi:hypothetical protein
MVSTGCGTVSQQTVELSTEVTARVKDLEQAHLLEVDAYFDRQRARVNTFLDEKWTPLFLPNFVATSGILQDPQAPQSVSQTTVRELEVALGEYLTDPGEAPEATRLLVRAINQGRGNEPATVASAVRAFVPDDQVDAASLHIAALLQVETAGVLMMAWSQAATEQIVARRDSLLGPIEAARRQAILEIRRAYADVYAGQGVITGRLEAGARRSTEEAKLVNLVGGAGTAAQLNAKLVAYAEAVNAAFSQANKLVERAKSGAQKLDALEGNLSAGLEAAATDAGFSGTEALSPPGSAETTTRGTPQWPIATVMLPCHKGRGTDEQATRRGARNAEPPQRARPT